MKHSVFFALLQYGLAVKNWEDSREEDQLDQTFGFVFELFSIFITVKHKLTSLQCGKRSSLKSSSSQRSSKSDSRAQFELDNECFQLHKQLYCICLKISLRQSFLQNINTTFKQTLTTSFCKQRFRLNRTNKFTVTFYQSSNVVA